MMSTNKNILKALK